MKFLNMEFSLAADHCFPLRSKYFPQQLFSNSFNLCSSLNVRDQVLNPSPIKSIKEKRKDYKDE
jgi:hypothetical protein